MENTTTYPIYPYNDIYMRYDKRTHRYVLTAEYLKYIAGIDIERRTQHTVQSQNVINSALDRISNLIYGYISKYNDAQTLRYIIAKCPSAREIIMDAMGAQATYVFSVGDLTLSAKPEEREAWLDMSAENILNSVEVRETGQVLTSVVEYSFNPPPYEIGDY